MNTSLAIRSGQEPAGSMDARFLQTLRLSLNDHPLANSSVASRVFATESISEQETVSFNQASTNLQTTLHSVLSQLNLSASGAKAGLVQVCETAAVQGALAAMAGTSFVSRKMGLPSSSENVAVVRAENVPNYLGHRSKTMALEAFDNRETRNAVLYTMAYNYSVGRQDEFGETVWPTLTLPADQVGFGIVVNRLTIHRGWNHTTDGKAIEFKKIDLMRAVRKPSILHRQKTRLFPVVRANALANFVDATVIAPADYDNEGVVIKTAPLKVGENIGLIGLSQTDARLDGGSANQTDTMDPAVSLENVYIKVGADVIKLNVYSHATANFTYAPQDVQSQRNLTFKTKAVSLKANTTQVGGLPLVALKAIKDSNLLVTLELQASGVANIEAGTVQVFGNRVAVVRVMTAEGETLPATNADVQDIMEAFATAAIVAYDVRAYSTNINMRERGDFIDRTNFTQLYEVPLLSPVTAQRPQNSDGQLDAGDFEALVTTTRFRMMGDAVTAIFDACERLSNFDAVGMSLEDIPASLGASRFHVRPTYYAPPVIDVATLVNSLTSSDRRKDLQAAIVNIIRDYVFRMFVNSEYPAAMAALGVQGNPTVIVATDPIIHGYIMLDGDLRTLTEKFNIRVVSTLNEDMEGKLFLTFGQFDETRNQAPNLLNWGNCVYAPEVVMSASVPRGESMSKETIVQPRYLFVNHLPVATLLSFKNIKEAATDSLSIKVSQVTPVPVAP